KLDPGLIVSQKDVRRIDRELHEIELEIEAQRASGNELRSRAQKALSELHAIQDRKELHPRSERRKKHDATNKRMRRIDDLNSATDVDGGRQTASQAGAPKIGNKTRVQPAPRRNASATPRSPGSS